ncbi:caax amino protease family protein [Thermosipho africanus H17ap60334]|uniref:CPBP family glutamic-type intramembrane protease n=1 Tax=Thermosipho africanus TaxID=2421 RepID=UPI00028C6A8A|nr:CPBP family glutamic-type intramembrane protease [Thermosipho africanus]EKF48456.1 caax amino protease family protein [Thermosipho africanus H17ap60334]
MHITISIFILLFYILLSKIFVKVVRISDPFKLHSLFAILTILYSILSARVLNLKLVDMGISFGDTKKGLLILTFIGIPLFIIAYITSKNAKIYNFRYLYFKSKWQIIYFWILVGPTEEFLFRGLIQSYLKLKYSSITAILLSSLLFTLFHLLNVLTKNESWKIFLNLLPTRFIISIILGFSLDFSKSLIYPIIIHNIIDGISFSNIKKNY